MWSQKLKVSVLGSLHICCGCLVGVFVGLLTMGVSVSMILLPSLGPLSSYWGTSSGLDIGFVALLIVSCYAMLSWYPSEAYPFLKWDEEAGDLRKRWGGEGSGKSRVRRESCNGDIVYERTMNKKIKKKFLW